MTRSHRFVSSLLAFCLAAVSCAAAVPSAHTQGDVVPRKTGTIFKSEVDGLINAIAGRTWVAGRAAPYTDSAVHNAMLLAALGHCHRFYTAIDHPRIRASIDTLIRARRPDGSFGTTDVVMENALLTGWTIDALQAMDSERYRDEIATAERWLKGHRQAPQTWAARVHAVMVGVRGDVFPQHLGKPTASEAAAMMNDPALDPLAATEAVVTLVACQTANRMLDRGVAAPAADFTEAQQRGVDFLMSRQKDGVFMAVYEGKEFPDPAITGFGLLALQTKPKALRTDAEQHAIEKGLAWLLTTQNEDGSFGRQVQNYTTSVVVGALSRWDNPATEVVLKNAQKYLLMCQNAEASGYQSSDRDYGGMGYGSGSNLRADMSNLNFALQALRETGLDAQHEAFQKALVFMQRTQNLKSVNTFTGKVTNPDKDGELIDVTSGDDGGSGYYPGNSAAGYIVQPDGKSQPRSYGSMTYALLKSYTLCGVGADDERIQAAVKWISANWTLAENPGFDPAMGEKARFQGLFYYYMVLAQALDMAGVDTVIATGADGKPQEIAWRKALAAKLESMQAGSGSWLNTLNTRWMEGFDVLCTCYALVALERCR